MLRTQQPPFDLCLSDVHMPTMDGFRLIECIGLEQNVPVISACAGARGRSARAAWH